MSESGRPATRTFDHSLSGRPLAIPQEFSWIAAASSRCAAMARAD